MLGRARNTEHSADAHLRGWVGGDCPGKLLVGKLRPWEKHTLFMSPRGPHAVNKLNPFLPVLYYTMALVFFCFYFDKDIQGLSFGPF